MVLLVRGADAAERQIFFLDWGSLGLMTLPRAAENAAMCIARKQDSELAYWVLQTERSSRQSVKRLQIDKWIKNVCQMSLMADFGE